MIISTTIVIAVQILLVSYVVLTEPEPCPNKYLRMRGEVHRYCDMHLIDLHNRLWKFTLKEEYAKD